MKILIFCSDQGNQRALAGRVAALAMPCAIVVVGGRTASPKKPGLAVRIRRFAVRAAGFIAGLPLRDAWFTMLAWYDSRFPAFPPARRIDVPDVNSGQVLDLVRSVGPDLVIVSGTNLLKTPLIARIRETGRILNLHTGISPYIKGGPNCTNWCLACGRFDLIGNTVMWLDAGIDSGNLVATERTPLRGTETLRQLHLKVMEHAHDLYLRCIHLALAGAELPSVPQADIGRGQLFLNRDWTPARMVQAITNFRRHFRRDVEAGPQKAILLVSPNGTGAKSGSIKSRAP